MPTIDRSVTTYTRKKRAELLTTFRKWNPNKRVEGPRSQSNTPYTEMKLATGFSSSAPPPENLFLEDIATFGGGEWTLNDPNTIITSNQTLTISSKQVLVIGSAETFTNNGIIVSNGGGIANSGTFSNYGTFDNYGDIGNVLSSGIIDNYGIIASNASGTNIQVPDGTFTNHIVGRISNVDYSTIQVTGGTFTNNGIISNIQGASIVQVNPGTFTNAGTIYSPTTDTGCGIGTIVGTITGTQSEDSCPTGPV
jgi:hypothetical protein